MRFLLYNIRYGTGVGWHFHIPFPFSGYFKNTTERYNQLVDFIKSLKPDIIGLIEVDSGSFRSRRECQATTLANELQHYFVYESKYAEGSFWQKLPLVSKQGNAFLTNQTVKANRIHYFKKGIKRLMLELELDDVAIFLVHLSIVYQHRHHQLKDIYKQIQKVQKPVIVAGDLNPLWGQHELEDFLKATGLKNANTKSDPSYPSKSPKRELDFILHSSQIDIKSFQMPHVRFSDHMPLVCDFTIKEN